MKVLRVFFVCLNKNSREIRGFLPKRLAAYAARRLFFYATNTNMLFLYTQNYGAVLRITFILRRQAF